jgi:hypothetical protein
MTFWAIGLAIFDATWSLSFSLSFGSGAQKSLIDVVADTTRLDQICVRVLCQKTSSKRCLGFARHDKPFFV